jgi:hypothetical protein
LILVKGGARHCLKRRTMLPSAGQGPEEHHEVVACGTRAAFPLRWPFAYDTQNVAFGSREWWAMKERERSTARWTRRERRAAGDDT